MIRLTGTSNGLSFNTSQDLNTQIPIATQNDLETKLPINNPVFTGKLTGTSIELEKNITINGITTINMLLCKFKKVNTNNNYSIENTYTNINICETADIVHLPLDPIDGMTINIRNLSKKDLTIKSNSNNIIYNLFLAPTGKTEIFLQQNFMFILTYNENLKKEGSWYLRF